MKTEKGKCPDNGDLTNTIDLPAEGEKVAMCPKCGRAVGPFMVTNGIVVQHVICPAPPVEGEAGPYQRSMGWHGTYERAMPAPEFRKTDAQAEPEAGEGEKRDVPTINQMCGLLDPNTTYCKPCDIRYVTDQGHECKPEPAPAEQVAGVDNKQMWCRKCYQPLEFCTDLDGHSDYIMPPPEDEKPVTLQLLVIDLGDCVVVKVEKGRPGTLNVEGYSFRNHSEGECFLIPRQFAEVRAAIDAMDEKPVPRIEVRDNAYWFTSLNEYGKESINRMESEQHKAYCQLAGVEIPVWTPKRGEWVQLHPTMGGVNGGPSFTLCGEKDGVQIWRYTKGER